LHEPAGPVAPAIYFADVRYHITVFYDPEFIRDNTAFDELLARMKQTYDGRDV
jgi:hypothetical protein